MKPTPTSLVVSAAMLAALVMFALNLRASEPSSVESEHGLLVERGRYLVNNVGLCADCHSPRNERGEYIRELWLEGAPIPMTPNVPMPWAQAAPPIAGLQGRSDEQMVAFLTTGLRPDGTRPRPPMPEYRFSEPDARAVIAYLRTLRKSTAVASSQ